MISRVPATTIFDYPAKVQIQTINLCNFKCSMCPYPVVSQGRKRAMIDRNILSRLIEETRKEARKIDVCLMLQNEPLLDRDFLEIAREFHAAPDAIRNVATVTNGGALRPDFLDAVMSLERFRLTISVNALDGEEYRRIQGVDRFASLVSTLLNWKGARGRVRLSYIADGSRIDDARAFIQRWHDAGYAVRLVPLMSRAGSLDVADDARFVADDFGYCHYPVDTMNVLADGRVILCCNDWQHNETFGNLSTQSVRTIWNSARMSELREAAIAGDLRSRSAICRDCDYPMRSAERIQLDSIVQRRQRDRTSFSQLPHGSTLRLSDGSEMAILVLEISVDGRIVAALQEPAPKPVTRGEVLLKISYSGLFSFGSLTPVWCPVEIAEVQDGNPTIIELVSDPRNDASRLLPWLRADWTPRSTVL